MMTRDSRLTALTPNLTAPAVVGGRRALGLSQSHSPSVRFGSAENPLSQEDIFARMGAAHEALKDAETRPDMFHDAVKALTNGGEDFIDKMMKALQAAKAQIQQTRSCELLRSEHGAEVGQKIRSGSFEKVFVNRRNFYPSDQVDFKSFLRDEKVFGKKQRAIIALTGWTKPPAHYLQQNEVFKEAMSLIPREKWPLYAEKIYVRAIKEYLGAVLDRLKKAGYNEDDVAFLYGVTPQGVDRAIEEFCEEKNVPYAGVTCYDWVPYVDDVAGKRPIYLAKDPKEFGQIMSDASDKLVVVGGRAFASTITKSGETVGKNKSMVPIDLMQMRYGIRIPAVVISDVDRSSSEVENAAAVLNGNKETNPANWQEVQEGMTSYEFDDPFEVKALVIILKKALQNIVDARKVSEELGV